MNTAPLKLNLADLEPMRKAFGQRLQSDVPLARYTAARIGGPAKVLLEIHSSDELAKAMSLIWQKEIPYFILGGGSNVLISDSGIEGIVIINQARQVRFNVRAEPPTVWAESGANFGKIARQSASLGFSGLEWASGIPGTVGGAIFGNAGAHGGDMSGNLLMAEILQHDPHLVDSVVREQWSVERFQFGYRSSILKSHPGRRIILTAVLELVRSLPEEVKSKINAYVEYRQRTQPPGASMGSMFKNPAADYAGRLIEVAGLKGVTVGDAQISELHANFFINRGKATARDVYTLLQMANSAVYEKFGIDLELEIELVGEW